MALNPGLPRWGWKKMSMLYLRWLSCTNSYCQLIRSYLGSFKFSKIMDALSIQILYINLSKINPKSTHQGYPPWGALALIRVWPWIKLIFFGHKPRFAQMGLILFFPCFIWGGFHVLIHIASSLDLTLITSNFQK